MNEQKTLKALHKVNKDIRIFMVTWIVVSIGFLLFNLYEHRSIIGQLVLMACGFIIDLFRQNTLKSFLNSYEEKD